MLSKLTVLLTNNGNTVLLPLALSLALFGIALLYWAWQSRKAHPVKAVVGWTLLLIASGLWIQFMGAEFGTVYSFMVLSLLAWTMCLFGSNKRKSASVKNSARIVNKTPKNLPRGLVRFLLITILSALSACLVTLAVTHYLPTPATNQLVLSAVFFPWVWAIFAYWASISQHLMRTGVSLSLVTAISAITIFG